MTMTGFLPPVIAHVGADVREFSAKMGEVKGEMATVEAQGGASFQKLAAVGKTALLAVSAAAVGVGVESIHLADQFEASHARLENAIHNSGAAFSSWATTVQTADKHLENFGFTNTETENSLSRLIPVTTSQAQATQLMSLAADVARARHLDLESATQLLVKVQTGHVALLGRLGINTKDLTGKTISQQEAIKRLTDMYGGSAARQSETFAGKLKTLEAQATDLGIKIGQFLIPIVEQVVGGFTDAAHWLEENRTVAYALGTVVGGFLVTAMGAFVALKVASTAKNIADAFQGIVGLAARVVGFFTVSEAGAAADAVAQDADATAAAANGVAHEVAGGQLAMFGAEAEGAGVAAEGAGVGAEGAAGGLGALGAAAAPAAIAIGGMFLAAQGLNAAFGQGEVAGANVGKSLGNLNDPIDKLSARYRKLIQDNKDLQAANTDAFGTIGGDTGHINGLASANDQLSKIIEEVGAKSVAQAQKLIEMAAAAGATSKQIDTLNGALTDAKVHHDDAAAASERLAAYQGGLAGTIKNTGGVVTDATGKVLGYATSFGFIPASKSTAIMADTSGFDAAIAHVQGNLARIGQSSATPGIGGAGSYHLAAKGGPVRGLTLVGEEGPELVDFDTPAHVYTAGETAALTASDRVASLGGMASGGSGAVVNNVTNNFTIVAPLGSTPDDIMQTINTGLAKLGRGSTRMAWQDQRVGRPGL